MKKTSETKYVAYEYRDAVIYGNWNPNAVALDQGTDNSDKRGWLAIPPLLQGTGAAQRIGNVIEPVKCKVTVQYYFVRNPQAATQDDASVQYSHLIQVRQMAFKPKGIKRWGDYINATGNTDHGYKRLLPALLEKGDGTLTFADGTNPLNMTYPLTNELVTPIKGNKKFLMAKNGTTIGTGAEGPLTTMRSQNTLSFSVKLPKKLKYSEVGGAPDKFPDNACPIFGAIAGIVQNASATSYDGLQKPYLPPLTSNPQHPILQLNYRIEMWFKDS